MVNIKPNMVAHEVWDPKDLVAYTLVPQLTKAWVRHTQALDYIAQQDHVRTMIVAIGK